eukprot:15329153-Ditylum_brightwellii.AAC.1
MSGNSGSESEKGTDQSNNATGGGPSGSTGGGRGRGRGRGGARRGRGSGGLSGFGVGSSSNGEGEFPSLSTTPLEREVSGLLLGNICGSNFYTLRSTNHTRCELV